METRADFAEKLFLCSGLFAAALAAVLQNAGLAPQMATTNGVLFDWRGVLLGTAFCAVNMRAWKLILLWIAESRAAGEVDTGAVTGSTSSAGRAGAAAQKIILLKSFAVLLLVFSVVFRHGELIGSTLAGVVLYIMSGSCALIVWASTHR